MKYRLSDDTWDINEENAVKEVLASHMFSMGEKVKQFEKEFSDKFGAKYAVMTSSGSTANLLAIAAMVYSHRLNPGDEVIVPAVSWSTTYFPLAQHGLKLRFVDIDSQTLNIDVSQLEGAITQKTKMIFLVNLLGNSNEFNSIKDICKNKNIIFAEDNCESMGAMYEGQKLGTMGLFGTYSTFYSHHLCTMEGGVVVTDDEILYHYMLAVRAHGWTRNLPSDSPIYTKKQDSFYESFNFIVPGYNLRPIEMEAAIGLEQLKKLDSIISQRRKNPEYFRERLKEIPGVRNQKEVGESSYFGFAVILEDRNSGKRNQVVEALRNNEIEVRPIVAGNFVRNKAIEYLDYTIYEKLSSADEIHDNGFFIGNHSCDNSREIDWFIETLKSALM